MNKFIRCLVSGLMVFAAVVIVGLTADPTEVQADYQGSTDPCGVTSGDKHDYAGLVVYIKIRGPDGSIRNPSGPGSALIHVASTGGREGVITSIGDGGNIVQGDGSDIRRRREKIDMIPDGSHTYQGKNCTGHGTSVVMGENKTSVGSAGGRRLGRDWKLDCDYSIRGPGGVRSSLPDFQEFTVSARGVPGGAKSGGTWSGGGKIRPVNGSTEKMTMIYDEPDEWDQYAGMNDGVNRPNSKPARDGGTVNPGETYNFRAVAENRGPSSSPSQTDLQLRTSEGASAINPGGRGSNWDNIGPLGNNQTKKYGHDFRVNNNAQDGQRICFWTRINHYERGSRGWRYSRDNYPGIPGRQTRCVTVRYDWRLIARMEDGDGRGAVSDGGVVTASSGIGNVYEFKAFTQNNGQDPSPPNTVAGFDNTDMELHTSDGANAITPGSRDRIWNNIGPVQPGRGGRVTRDHQFQVEYYSDARNDGERVCFYSRAHPKDRSSNSNNWAYSPDNYSGGSRETRCVRVQYPYTIKGELDAPEGGDGYLEPGETHTVEAIYRNDDIGDTRTGFNDNVTSLNIEWKALPPSSSGTTRDPSKIIEVKPSYPHYQTSTSWQKTHNSNMNPDDSSRENTLSGKFRVKDTARPDDRVCFQGFYSPSKYRPPGSPFGTFETPVTVTDATCIKVDVQRKPYLTTSEGDVHAGAETCSEPYLHVPGTSKYQPFQVAGRTKGSNGSKATYVTSASGPVDNFGSNDSPDDDELTFGNDPSLGNYGLICHVDPYNSNQSAAAGGAPPALTNGNINDPSVFGNGIHQRNGDLKIEGGVVNVNSDTSVTVLVSGDVYIRSNVEYASGGYQVDQMPGLAIVASGNIYIDPGVTRLDGIYYTNGIFNTCKNSLSGNQNSPDITSGGTAGNCDNQLEINGSALANEFQFRRTVDDVNNSSPKPALQVNLLPQHLVAPPPGFGGAFESNIRYLGERPPAF